MTDWEEGLCVELRRALALPLDDIVEAMRRCLNPALSRSAIHRCLKRHGLSARRRPEKAPVLAFETDSPAGFIHIDVKYLPPLARKRSYAYVAIDRATRFVYLEVLPDRRGQTAAGFLERFLARFALPVHTILTDNGSEFTDRFAVDKPGKPKDKPTGDHLFDVVCRRHRIAHRLTRPFRPQTNGMVERFNRRIAEHLGRMPQNRAAHHRRFFDHAERDAYLHSFVADYNHTRLRCLNYHAPAEALANLTGQNTQAGAGLYGAFDVKPYRRIRGELAVERESARYTLVFGRSEGDLDHDAVIRIGGAAPGRQAHSLGRRLKPCLPRVTAASDRHGRTWRSDVDGTPNLA